MRDLDFENVIVKGATNDLGKRRIKLRFEVSQTQREMADLLAGWTNLVFYLCSSGYEAKMRCTTGAQNQKVGAAGQQQGALALRRAGVEQVEHIGTPIKRTPHPEKKWAELGYAKVVYGEEVAADHRGVLPGGRSVLAEVKTVFDGNLTWTHFKAHQPGKLTEHAEYGGLSVVVWVSPKGCFILRWPIPGFKKGKGVTLEQAEALDLVDLRPFAKGG